MEDQNSDTFYIILLKSQVRPTILLKNDFFYIFQLNCQEFTLFEHMEVNHLNYSCFLFLISYRFSEQLFLQLQKCIPFFHINTQYSHRLSIFNKSSNFIKLERINFS